MKILPALLLLLTGPAAAPVDAQGAAGSPVDAAWFVRAEGERLEARIVLDVEEGQYIYHTELGHPNASGMPTAVELTGADFGSVRFPEPKPKPETDWSTQTKIEVLTHSGRVVLSANAPLVEAGSVPSGLELAVRGLACNELGCVPFELAGLAPAGRGDDALFRAEAEPTETAPAAYPDRDWVQGGEADATLYVRRGAGEAVRGALVIELSEGYHLYGHELGHPEGASYAVPTELEWEDGPVQWETVRWPEAHELEMPFSDGVWVYAYDAADGPVVVQLEGRAPRDADLSAVELTVRGQTCNDVGCIDYTESVVTRGAGADALFAAVSNGAAAPAKPEAAVATEFTVEGDQKPKQGLLQFLLLAVGWGLFALVMPCTYPMIPITISFFTKQADARGGKVLPLSAAYGAGIVLIFVFIGVVFGSAIIPFANHPVTNLAIGVLFVYFALVLFGIIDMQPPRFLMRAAGKASTKGGYAGVFLMGATLVVTSFTCTGPFVGSLLGAGAQLGLWQVALGMGVFGLTMAVPFVVLSLVPGKVATMPQAGQWMNTVKHFLGFVELAAALKFLSNADLAWDWYVISREFFLVAWALLLGLGGLYLLGAFAVFGPEPKAGKVQALIGALTLAFAGYCGWGAAGNTMDSFMQALIPPYSGGRVTPELWDPNVSWDLVMDDYDAALELARKEDKLLLVNFTGHL
ncbi:MAG: protein-disulfide reductase DsbD domain-containing protein [Planctomycetota bacterium]